MKQLALELAEYPRPIAWTLSEVDRAVGSRDRRDMLLAAFEEVTRYFVLVQLARYTEYWQDQRGDGAVEQQLLGLRRPSFGHYVGAFTSLDKFLSKAGDTFAAHLDEPSRSSPLVNLLRETQEQPVKASLAAVLRRIVELRNREKGHGYTGQLGAKAMAELLEPCLAELLSGLPSPLRKRLVWIERIEYIDASRSVITLLELMGTQRARRTTQDVREPGELRKGFVYMWDGTSSPLQMTPFLHLEQTSHDELVYALAGFGGEPVYQARGSSASGRHPDRLMAQLEERAPFLLKTPPSVTKPRIPAAAKLYRSAVEVALADGEVTEPEAKRLDHFRVEVGLSEAEAETIHRELGWSDGNERLDAPPQPAEPQPPEQPDPTPHEQQPDAAPLDGSLTGAPEQPEAAVERPRVGSADQPEPAKDLSSILRRICSTIGSQLGTEQRVTIDEDVGLGVGELWIELGLTQGVSVWFPRKHAEHLVVAIGFYSTNRNRDARFRAGRERLEGEGTPTVPSGWAAWSHESRAAGLAFETKKKFSRDELVTEAVLTEVGSITSRLTMAARRALDIDVDVATHDSTPPANDETELEFMLESLVGTPRIRGSVWIPRILWALEWGRRNDAGPMTAADIARALESGGVAVPPTNTARAFRTPSDDPRRAGLCEERGDQRYAITLDGRRALSELLTAHRA